jgi:hypothetical protein
MKLKYTELKNYRQTKLAEQGHKCYLCGEPIIDDAVLDHDHKTGLIRRVLHRGCNALLGKIENNMARNRITVQRLSNIADNLIKYITNTHTDIRHPTHKTKGERNATKKRLRSKNNLKKHKL